MYILTKAIAASVIVTAITQPAFAVPSTTTSGENKPAVAAREKPKSTEERAAFRWEGSVARVKQAQEALNRSGSNLKVDGVLGEDTRVELRKYQRTNSLMETGRIDDATAKSLGIEMK
jgi:hypothetical protein